MSCMLACGSSPRRSTSRPIFCSNSKARPVLTGSFGMAMRAPCGTGSPRFKRFENNPIVVEYPYAMGSRLVLRLRLNNCRNGSCWKKLASTEPSATAMLGITQSLNSTSSTRRPCLRAWAMAISVASFATLGITAMRKGLSCAALAAPAAASISRHRPARRILEKRNIDRRPPWESGKKENPHCAAAGRAALPCPCGRPGHRRRRLRRGRTSIKIPVPQQAAPAAKEPAVPAIAATAAPRGLTLIGAPTDIGAGSRGASMGPEALRVAGLGPALQALGYDVEDAGNLSGPPNPGLPPQQGYRHLAEVAA